MRPLAFAQARTPLQAAQRRELRPLNTPVPLRVQRDAHGRLVSIRRYGRLAPRTVIAVQSRWRIDDEWWREHPISRAYYELLLDDGSVLTVYHDLLREAWFEQRG